MIRRYFAWALPALLAAALIAGCGSSSSSSSTSGAASTATPTSSGSTGTSSAGAETTATTPAPPKSASAVASCLNGVKALPKLKAATRLRLESICRKDAGRDTKETREAAVEACEELVKASPLPAGKARDRALATCKHAGGSKAGGG